MNTTQSQELSPLLDFDLWQMAREFLIEKKRHHEARVNLKKATKRVKHHRRRLRLFAAKLGVNVGALSLIVLFVGCAPEFARVARTTVESRAAAVAEPNPTILWFEFRHDRVTANCLARFRASESISQPYPWPVWTNWPFATWTNIGYAEWRTPSFVPVLPQQFFVMTLVDGSGNESPPNQK